MNALWFVVSSAVGSLARSAATSSAALGRRLVGTLAVNVIGSFLLGVVAGYGASFQLVIGVGGLGSLTTFSTFIGQVDSLDNDGRRDAAIGYAGATLVLGIGAAWLGLRLGR